MTRRQFFENVIAGVYLATTSPKKSALVVEEKISAPRRVIGEIGESEVKMSMSDMGSLFQFIQSQVVKTPSLSFLQDEFRDLNLWRQQAKSKVLELLHYKPAPCDPNPEVVERVDKGDYIREKVWFNTTPDIRVPAYVLIPKNFPFPAPAIVALHDHGGFYLWGKEKLVDVDEESPALRAFRSYYSGKFIAVELVKQGYVVVVIDMFYWGERRMLLDDDPVVWKRRPNTITDEEVRAFNQRASQSEQLVGRTIYSAGFTWSGVMFWDDIRTVDYLITRPEVDKGRLGCVGLSVGGLRSMHLAALDERVKAAVVVGWMTSFPSQLKSHIRNTIGHTKLVPGLYKYLDYPDVGALTIPRSLMVINGSQDKLFDADGVCLAFDKLTASYKKAGVADRCAVRLYDAPHEFNNEMQKEAWDWLKKWV